MNDHNYLPPGQSPYHRHTDPFLLPFPDHDASPAGNQQPEPPLFRQYWRLLMSFRQRSPLIATVIFSLYALGISLVVMVPINILLDGSLLVGIVISTIICLVIVPMHLYHTLHLIHALEQAREQFRIAAITDPLTGTYNRRWFMQILHEYTVQPVPSFAHLALIIVDIDRFKTINDTYGHLTGDAVIRHVCTQIRTSIRSSDVLARIGGEEFALIVSSAPAEALRIAERLRMLVAVTPLVHHGMVVSCTVSVGVAVTAHSSTVSQLFQQADQALYQAKEQGRNRVVLYEACHRITYDSLVAPDR